MKQYIGVDLGGTLVRAAIVDEAGKIIRQISRPSFALENDRKIMDNFIATIKELDFDNKVVGIGIGVPGPVDVKAGAMTMATNIPALENYPVVKAIHDAFNLPVFMDNDANVAGLAEAVLGAGKALPVVYYITHSTGIGGALIVNGQVVSGARGHAGEIGNIIIDRNREKYSELNAGSIETEASGGAILRRGQELLGPEIKTTKDVFDQVAVKNPLAIKLVDEIAYDFAVLLANVAHVVDPDIFVIGGGVTKSKDHYFDAVIRHFKTLVHDPMQETKFAFASLVEPGIVGAAMLPKSQGY